MIYRGERYFGSQPYSIDSALSVWRFIASTHGDGVRGAPVRRPTNPRYAANVSRPSSDSNYAGRCAIRRDRPLVHVMVSVVVAVVMVSVVVAVVMVSVVVALVMVDIVVAVVMVDIVVAVVMVVMLCQKRGREGRGDVAKVGPPSGGWFGEPACSADAAGDTAGPEGPACKGCEPGGGSSTLVLKWDTPSAV